jgi:hypothetical protein
MRAWVTQKFLHVHAFRGCPPLLDQRAVRLTAEEPTRTEPARKF